MKCTDKLFIINTTVFHQKIINFDFMPTLTQATQSDIYIEIDVQQIARLEIC